MASPFIWLLILPLPVACIAWTVTHEEVFKEPREYCKKKGHACNSLLKRKFFYLFTCEYCFSHYVTVFFIIFTGYKLLMDNWIGYLISFFAVVWVANVYMSVFALLRQEIKSEKIKNEVEEVKLDAIKENGYPDDK